MFIVKLYNEKYYTIWNEFVGKAKNATFLFHRNFMDYHNDRFQDYSLLIFDEKENLKAILPANRVENTVYSHQGLTYGGLVLAPKTKTNDTFKLLDTVLHFFKNNAIEKLQIKKFPVFYSPFGNCEFDYYCFKNKANLIKREMNLVFPLGYNELLSKSKLKHFAKTSKLALEIKESTRFNAFWNMVLLPRLAEKHQTKPVHTLEEITLLAQKFPNNIKQFDVYFENTIVAGITLFIDKYAVKSQYGATTALGEKIRALDFLYFSLYEKFVTTNILYFDMGTVTDFSFEQDYNAGLLQQKEELGGVVYNQDCYEFDLNSFCV
ncbi:FemAB family protein [Flavobacterium sp.]|uniref:FemAB family protein n=1 Tax=Flavobacterium sp. TaxID=239 RepID=UPI0035294FC2